MTRTRRFTIALLVATLFPALAAAQDSTRRDPWLSTFSVGFPGFEGDMVPMLVTVGGNFTKLGVGKVSPDFSIGTMPYALSLGAMAWGLRGGVALPMQVSEDVFLLPSAGVSSIVAFGAGGGGGVAGTNIGIAMATRTGARVGITWHRFSDIDTVMLLEFGVGRIR